MAKKGDLYASRRDVQEVNNSIDPGVYSRRGHAWSVNEQDQLRTEFLSETPLRTICVNHHRTPGSILAAMKALGLIRQAEDWTYYYAVTTSTKETTTMNAKVESEVAVAVIESKTFIKGRDAAEMSDKEIFRVIASLEAEKGNLGLIKAKSKKIAAAMKSLQDDIDKLVEFVDNRE